MWVVLLHEANGFSAVVAPDFPHNHLVPKSGPYLQRVCKIVGMFPHSHLSVVLLTSPIHIDHLFCVALLHSNPLCKALLTFGVHVVSAEGFVALHCNSSSSDTVITVDIHCVNVDCTWLCLLQLPQIQSSHH